VLLKRGPLTPDEYELIKEHTVIGDRLCGELRSLQGVRPIVRHHHERLDGSGYPDGLRGDAIPLLAQIMGIVDVFDALTTERPYKTALPFARAVEELRREAARVRELPAKVQAGEKGEDVSQGSPELVPKPERQLETSPLAQKESGAFAGAASR